MNSSNQPENTNKDHVARPNLGKVGETDAMTDSKEMLPMSDREIIEQTLDGLAMAQANMTRTIKACNGTTRGSYRVVISTDREYNEVQIRLKDGPAARHAIATGYIDRGHTREDKAMAAEELRGLVRAYLCR